MPLGETDITAMLADLEAAGATVDVTIGETTVQGLMEIGRAHV